MTSSSPSSPSSTPIVAVAREPFLSLCLIVKNAEKTIDRLLDSVFAVEGFDEIVFVDTGSMDGTIRKLCARFKNAGTSALDEGIPYHFESRPGPSEGEGRVVIENVELENGSKLTLARFGWCDDFASARNYAFSLAHGKWRMYLDADDALVCTHPEILAGARRPDGSLKRFNLAKTIEMLDSRVEPAGSLNALTLPYEYKAGSVRQDVIRCWKWSAGWAWRDAVHENVVPAPTETAHQKIIAGLLDVVVRHAKNPEDNHESFLRNKRIIEKQLARTDIPQDARDRYVYGYSNSLRGLDDYAGAIDALEATVKNCAGTSFEIFALCDLAKIWIELDARGQADAELRALDAAGRLVSRYPELADGYEHQGVIHARAGRFDRAARSFDACAACAGRMKVSSNQEIWFSEGAAVAARALAYLRMGRLVEGQKVLGETKHSEHAHVRPLFFEAMRVNAHVTGLELALRFADFLVSAAEPVYAAKFLREISSSVGALEAQKHALDKNARLIEAGLWHTESFEAYRKAYAELPEHTTRAIDDEFKANVFALVRVQMLLNWVDSLPKEGDPVVVLLVGVQDGVYEAELLARNERIHITVAEIAGESKATRALREKYGDARVHVHEMKAGLWDWFEAAEFYDAIVCFEVVEHFQERGIFNKMAQALRAGGRLFLSTPVPECWIEPPNPSRPFTHHVHAFGAARLHEQLTNARLVGELSAAHDGTYVFEGVKDESARPAHQLVQGLNGMPYMRHGRSLGIYIPPSATPFDARSHERGHLGGSEEAVIHLSAALAARGHQVTVYAPANKDEVGRIVAKDGVLWRRSEEFDFGGDSHEAALFWRCPEIMRLPELAANKKLVKLLWLHDSYYNAAPSTYAAADGVIALSKFHAACLQQKDGASPENFIVLQNGVDAAAFPEPDESLRDPFKVVYTSSPDRGLAVLLDMWPKIQARVPEASLDIYYDWKGARWLKPELVEQLEEHLKFLSEYTVPRADGEGVVEMKVRYIGGVPHNELHDAMRKAGVWAYPTGGDAADGKNPSPETFCITAVKVAACGCYPVVTDAGALPEVVVGGTTVCREGSHDWQSVFVQKVVEALRQSPLNFDNMTETRRWLRSQALERFSWAKTAELFEDAIETVL